MVVAVEQGLIQIKQYLKEQGFTVTEIDTKQPVDAIVYQNSSILDLPVPQMHAQTNSTQNAAGTLLVCAYGKTPEQVETILRQKAYSNLF